jgi:hypothetical protein
MAERYCMRSVQPAVSTAGCTLHIHVDGFRNSKRNLGTLLFSGAVAGNLGASNLVLFQSSDFSSKFEAYFFSPAVKSVHGPEGMSLSIGLR